MITVNGINIHDVDGWYQASLVAKAMGKKYKRFTRTTTYYAAINAHPESERRASDNKAWINFYLASVFAERYGFVAGVALDVTRKDANQCCDENTIDGREGVNLTDAAQLLGFKPRLFISLLMEMNYVYKQQSKGRYLRAYQEKIDSGMFVHVLSGKKEQFISCLITPKGLELIKRRLDAACGAD